tara:strand:- start:576 stop:1352 length:777 start_codon:yes stop_codon:yes gene_type:complete
MSKIRIFSYLPNPRVWKAVIAGKLCNVEVEVIGDKPRNLPNWIWDYDARILEEEEKQNSPHKLEGKRGFTGNLFKTSEFLNQHPFGTVPAAFVGENKIGVFESNSIMRAVTRMSSLTELYGGNDSSLSSRIDSFLDANLVFSREHQVYILSIENLNSYTYDRMKSAYEFYLDGIELSLSNNKYIAGNKLSLADISFVCDFSQFLREGHYEESLAKQGYKIISKNIKISHPKTIHHLIELSERNEFSSVMGSYLEWFKK